MATREERAGSFGAVADVYDRVRPGPPAAALDWLLPQTCRRAADLGAGTGLFTRALAQRVPDVVGVEPDQRMRLVLRDRSPGVHVVGARAEALPVRDGVMDAVCASSSWHWVDPVQAVPEVARVLRDGGRLALIWTSRDREVEWVRSLDRLRTSTDRGTDQQVLAQRRPRDVVLPDPSPFVNAATASFTFSRPMTIDELVQWVGTYSGVLTAPPREREQGLQRVRTAVADRFGEDAVVDVPMRSWCWRADREPG
ncbi:MAG TPA: class I SAM-dependent methyltransferase [Mycobacteriales bacterium]|nr:class I SAM-dependent methyltransferase [Mycobacteriales bacterium]